ncbi:hypothetical protein ACSAZL_11165 [Methanosarcina sp. T3]|uniref:hypothetical protein n=1 Tax=Methanosarcina sp. T3 TaxID=3439062 RepID=UPI003F830D04
MNPQVITFSYFTDMSLSISKAGLKKQESGEKSGLEIDSKIGLKIDSKLGLKMGIKIGLRR